MSAVATPPPEAPSWWSRLRSSWDTPVTTTANSGEAFQIGRPAQRPETRRRSASRLLRSLFTWRPIWGSGRTDNRESERRTTAARSWDASRNHMVAAGAMCRLKTNVVGTGIVPYAQVDYETLGISAEEADELNTLIDDHWRYFAENPRECDAEGTQDFYQQQWTTLGTAALSGDCFVTTPFIERPGCRYGLKFQLIDPARVSQPYGQFERRDFIDGIQFDDVGMPIFYHIRSEHPDDDLVYPTNNVWTAVAVWGPETGERRAFHVWCEIDQIGKVRGTPWLGPILEPLQTLEQYTRAELMAACVSSMFTVFLKKEKDQLAGIGEQAFTSEEGEGPQGSGNNSEKKTGLLQMGNAAILDLQAGEEPVFANPTRPNANYDPFFLALVTQMGAALGLPVDELMLRYQQSYTAARAAMHQAFRTYLVWRGNIVKQHSDPARSLWFDEAVARGIIPVKDYGDPLRRAAYHRAMWLGPERGAMDELKEAQAASERINNGTSNETIETAVSGKDWKIVQSQRAREIARKLKDGTLQFTKYGQGAGGGAPAPVPASDDPNADPADPNAPPKQEGAESFEVLRAKADTYGVAVRAGVITPQTADEEGFRKSMSLPAMGPDAQKAWADDKGVRRPITLAPPAGAASKPAFGGGPPAPPAPGGDDPPEPKEDPPEDE